MYEIITTTSNHTCTMLFEYPITIQGCLNTEILMIMAYLYCHVLNFSPDVVSNTMYVWSQFGGYLCHRWYMFTL